MDRGIERGQNRSIVVKQATSLHSNSDIELLRKLLSGETWKGKLHSPKLKTPDLQESETFSFQAVRVPLDSELENSNYIQSLFTKEELEITGSSVDSGFSTSNLGYISNIDNPKRLLKYPYTEGKLSEEKYERALYLEKLLPQAVLIQCRKRAYEKYMQRLVKEASLAGYVVGGQSFKYRAMRNEAKEYLDKAEFKKRFPRGYSKIKHYFVVFEGMMCNVFARYARGSKPTKYFMSPYKDNNTTAMRSSEGYAQGITHHDVNELSRSDLAKCFVIEDYRIEERKAAERFYIPELEKAYKLAVSRHKRKKESILAKNVKSKEECLDKEKKSLAETNARNAQEKKLAEAHNQEVTATSNEILADFKRGANKLIDIVKQYQERFLELAAGKKVATSYLQDTFANIKNNYSNYNYSQYQMITDGKRIGVKLGNEIIWELKLTESDKQGSKYDVNFTIDAEPFAQAKVMPLEPCLIEIMQSNKQLPSKILLNHITNLADSFINFFAQKDESDAGQVMSSTRKNILDTLADKAGKDLSQYSEKVTEIFLQINSETNPLLTKFADEAYIYVGSKTSANNGIDFFIGSASDISKENQKSHCKLELRGYHNPQSVFCSGIVPLETLIKRLSAEKIIPDEVLKTLTDYQNLFKRKGHEQNRRYLIEKKIGGQFAVRIRRLCETIDTYPHTNVREFFSGVMGLAHALSQLAPKITLDPGTIVFNKDFFSVHSIRDKHGALVLLEDETTAPVSELISLVLVDDIVGHLINRKVAEKDLGKEALAFAITQLKKWKVDAGLAASFLSPLFPGLPVAKYCKKELPHTLAENLSIAPHKKTRRGLTGTKVLLKALTSNLESMSVIEADLLLPSLNLPSQMNLWTGSKRSMFAEADARKIRVVLAGLVYAELTALVDAKIQGKDYIDKETAKAALAFISELNKFLGLESRSSLKAKLNQTKLGQRVFNSFPMPNKKQSQELQVVKKSKVPADEHTIVPLFKGIESTFKKPELASYSNFPSMWRMDERGVQEQLAIMNTISTSGIRDDIRVAAERTTSSINNLGMMLFESFGYLDFNANQRNEALMEKLDTTTERLSENVARKIDEMVSSARENVEWLADYFGTTVSRLEGQLSNISSDIWNSMEALIEELKPNYTERVNALSIAARTYLLDTSE